MKEVYLIDGVRTAIGNFGGGLSSKSAVDMGVAVVREILKRNKIDAANIDEVLMGCVLPTGLGQNVARQIAIGAGIPNTKTAMTVNMVCGSGLRTVTLATQAIKNGDAEIIVAGGTESMSNSPYIIGKARFGYKMGNAELTDSMIKDGLWDIYNNYHMGVTAENLAVKYNLSREEQDQFACESQNKAEAATKENKFNDEIVSIEIPQKKGDPIIFNKDEFVRFGATTKDMAKLQSAFKKDGTVTAANSSGVNDGAACVIVASADAVKKYGLKPMAKIISYSYHGVDPSIMGIGPVEAVKSALNKAGWNKNDLDLVELNEAFAAQSLSVLRELGLNKNIVNVNGGAIALGHPIGASGARILTTLLHEMKRRGLQKGLASLCIGGGMGIAVCVQRI
ncbi:MAG: acetyl-CoA C-acetyltransferase [Proteobacteria bacterium]|nr:acetyl-CoA C-acetyltransferase [Pseudomonadota bacterium]